ncbi:hypothetical protein M9M90_00970 [Phenylobacterium sp. LH3H17]|uniref:hypothetical protein n=1 Tax=Phenylobacterium sp. LH3H17 TaxID=2903901 RepID=UPI0020C97FCB|nr:hypothetical protein [Phenylobacterium sp. LH3H17]UTP39776.1 hypothetical protein M9M90_00970 [Phenylobacterium sp. LH3H17]
MASEVYQKFVKELTEDFPLGDAAADFPALSVPLDDGVQDLIQNALAAVGEAANPLYVEDLLNDCMVRIGNCLSLRDRAYDLEVRAVGDALAYRVEKAALDLQNKSLAVLGPHQGKLLQNAIGLAVGDKVIAPQSLDETAWKELEVLQRGMNAAVTTALGVRKAKASEDGNGSNYSQRFAFVKSLFDLNIVEAYLRCRVCRAGLKEIYKIDLELPAPSPTGYLDKLAKWAQEASDKLDRELDSRSIGNAIFALSSDDEAATDLWLMAKGEYEAGVAARHIPFRLTSSNFERLGMKDVLLRSVRIQARPVDDTKTRVWQAVLALPHNNLTRRIEKFAAAMSSSYQDLAEAETVVRGVHNISPIGQWAIDTLSAKSLTGEPTTKESLKNIYVMLRVSYRPL